MIALNGVFEKVVEADAKTLLHERSTSTESLGKPSAWAQTQTGVGT